MKLIDFSKASYFKSLFKDMGITSILPITPIRVNPNSSRYAHAVLDEENHFYGILTHSRLLDMLSDAWDIKNGSYVLTVLSDNARGNLIKMSKIVSKHTNMSSVMTLDAAAGELQGDFVRRTLFTLPAGVSEITMKAIVDKLQKKGFVVSEIEDLQAGMTIMSDENPGVFIERPSQD